MSREHKVRAELRRKGLDGISDEQLDQHWALYEGYVKNVNLLESKLAALREKGDFGPEFAEMKRRLGFEYNGMVLHELYFEGLSPGHPPLDHAAQLTKALKTHFGGFETWRKEFSAIGKMRGVGWVVLYLDPQRRALGNHWITLHEEGHLCGFAPLVVMDVWEHAYMVDWGASGRGDYIDAWFKNVDWSVVEARLSAVSRPAPVHAHARKG